MLSFIIFTITNTFFQNIEISLFVFIFCLFFITIFLIVKYKNRFFTHTKYIIILLLAFIVSLWAIVVKQYNYSPELAKEFVGFNEIPAANFVNKTGMTSGGSGMTWEKQVFGYYIWTWKMVDTYSFGKYIFHNFSWEKYILNTEKRYKIWDELRLVWYVKDVNLLGLNNNFSWLWNRSFDYDKRLIMKGYRGNIYEQNWIVLESRSRLQTSSTRPEWQIGLIQKMKRSLQSQIISTYGEGRNAWLILWMLIGDKSQIPKSDYQNFIDSWLVHLIAVSGWNIIMLTIFLWFVLFFLPFYFRNFVILLSIILYSLVCWMDSSVMRAVIFGWLGMMALFVGREINFRRSVYIVFVLMLLFNPYFLLYDLWFLLSFGAIIGIRIFNWNKDIEEKKEIPAAKLNAGMTAGKSEWQSSSEQQTYFVRKLTTVYKSYIKPSIWANLWIFPVIIFFMWKINLIWFVTNLFVLPIVPFVMIYGFISIFLYWLWPRSGFIYIQELLINYIYRVSEIGSDYWIYLLVTDYKIKHLILILFIVWLIIYMIKNKIIFQNDSTSQNRLEDTVNHKTKKSNRLSKKSEAPKKH